MKRPVRFDPEFFRWWRSSGYAAICPSNGPDNEAYLAAKAAWKAAKIHASKLRRRVDSSATPK